MTVRTLRICACVNSDKKSVMWVRNQFYLILRLKRIFNLAALVLMMIRLSMLLRSLMHGSLSAISLKESTSMLVQQVVRSQEVKNRELLSLVHLLRTLKSLFLMRQRQP